MADGNMDDPKDNRTCRYCGTKDPVKGFTERKIIHRKWDSVRRKQVVGESHFTVCNNDQCGGYLQMGYEG